MGNCLRTQDDHTRLLPLTTSNRPSVTVSTSQSTSDNNTSMPKLITVNRQTDMNAIKAAQSRNLFEHLPLVNYNEKLVKQTDCAICLIDFLPNEQVRQLPCDGGHVFHPQCIDSWLEKSLTCPHCSINVDAVLLLKFVPKSTHDDDDDDD